MIDIEQKALALVREVLAERDLSDKRAVRREVSPYTEALCRAIEQHEAFKQEVSDAITVLLDRCVGDSLSQGVINGHLHHLIIPKPKPDPLVAVLLDLELSSDQEEGQHDAKWLRLKLDALGFEIREKGQ
jgi:hypothetical protein